MPGGPGPGNYDTPLSRARPGSASSRSGAGFRVSLQQWRLQACDCTGLGVCHLSASHARAKNRVGDEAQRHPNRAAQVLSAGRKRPRLPSRAYPATRAQTAGQSDASRDRPRQETQWRRLSIPTYSEHSMCSLRPAMSDWRPRRETHGLRKNTIWCVLEGGIPGRHRSLRVSAVRMAYRATPCQITQRPRDGPLWMRRVRRAVRERQRLRYAPRGSARRGVRARSVAGPS